STTPLPGTLSDSANTNQLSGWNEPLGVYSAFVGTNLTPVYDTVTMTNQSLHRSLQCAVHHQTRWGAVLLGFATFGLLWMVFIPSRRVYVPNGLDIPALADGLLLAPGAHWEDWFTVGYSHFWDSYPEWPRGMTGFTRPAFQFVIYLVHFALGRDWAS